MQLTGPPPDAAMYRGEDRRQRQRTVPVPPRPPARAHLLGLVAASVVALLVAMLVLSGDATRDEALDHTLRLLRAAAFTGAGLLGLVRWRVTGLTRPAFIGVALLGLGVLGEATSSLGPLLLGEAQPMSDRLVNSAAALAAAVLVVWARRAPAVDAGARPTRLLVVVGVSVPLLAVGSVLVAAQHTAGATGSVLAAPTALVAALWLAMTVSEHRAGLERHAPWLVHVLALVSLSFAAFTGAAWEREPANGVGAALFLAAGVVALRGAARDLTDSLSAQSQDLLRLTVDVHEHEQKQRSAQAQQEERLHEVRNVLSGLHGATATLRKYEDRLDPGVRRRLEDAVSDELRRLSHLVDPSLAPPTVDIDVPRALEPVIVAEREQGAQLSVDLQEVSVRGHAAELATVVSALLVNARKHAPGSPVLLRAEHRDGETRLYVEDRGGGVPLDQREAVFERGERAGATVAGSGLGLYVAKRLVGEMGGTVEVHGRAGGGASFVVTLPSSAVAAVPDARQLTDAGGPR